MDILAGRLDDPWLIYDQVTDQTVTEMKNLKNSKKLSVSKFASPRMNGRNVESQNFFFIGHPIHDRSLKHPTPAHRIGLMPLNDLSRINLVNLFSKHQPYAFETHPNDFKHVL